MPAIREQSRPPRTGAAEPEDPTDLPGLLSPPRRQRRGWLAQSGRLPQARRPRNFHGPMGLATHAVNLFPLFTEQTASSKRSPGEAVNLLAPKALALG